MYPRRINIQISSFIRIAQQQRQRYYPLVQQRTRVNSGLFRERETSHRAMYRWELQSYARLHVIA